MDGGHSYVGHRVKFAIVHPNQESIFAPVDGYIDALVDLRSLERVVGDVVFAAAAAAPVHAEVATAAHAVFAAVGVAPVGIASNCDDSSRRPHYHYCMIIDAAGADALVGLAAAVVALVERAAVDIVLVSLVAAAAAAISAAAAAAA